MAIRFTCPAGHRLKVPDEKAGRGLLCPICEESVTVPEAEDADSEVVRGEPPSVEESAAANTDEQLLENEVAAIGAGASVPPPPGRPIVATQGSGSAARPRRGNAAPWGVAVGSLIVIAYSMLPTLGHLRDIPTPLWVRGVLGMALLQTVFVIWMVLVRHWAAIVIVAVSFAFVSTAYAIFACFAFGLLNNHISPDALTSRAAVWSTTVLAIYLLATYLCGVAAVSWRREAIDESSR